MYPKTTKRTRKPSRRAVEAAAGASEEPIPPPAPVAARSQRGRARGGVRGGKAGRAATQGEEEGPDMATIITHRANHIRTMVESLTHSQVIDFLVEAALKDPAMWPKLSQAANAPDTPTPQQTDPPQPSGDAPPPTTPSPPVCPTTPSPLGPSPPAPSTPRPTTPSRPPPPGPSPSGPLPPGPVPWWCTCHMCREMPTVPEMKCCRKQQCTAYTLDFNMLMLDPLVLHILDLLRNDVLHAEHEDRQDINRVKRKSAYRAYTLWKHGRLGGGNRIPAPSCCVWRIRGRYPDPNGIYRGFQPGRLA